KPFYVYLNIESATTVMGHIALTNGPDQKCTYHFEIVEGQYNYAIRLSANYFWWQKESTKLTFTADGPIKMTKFSLLAADGSVQIPYSDNWSTFDPAG